MEVVPLQQGPPLTKKLLLNRITAILEESPDGTFFLTELSQRYFQVHETKLIKDVKLVEKKTLVECLATHTSRFRPQDQQVSLVASPAVNDMLPAVVKDRLIRVMQEAPRRSWKVSELCSRYKATHEMGLRKEVRMNVVEFLRSFPNSFEVWGDGSDLDVKFLGEGVNSCLEKQQHVGRKEAKAFVNLELECAERPVLMGSLGKLFHDQYNGADLKDVLGVKRLKDYFVRSEDFLVHEYDMVSFRPQVFREKLSRWLSERSLTHLDKHFGPNESILALLKFTDQDLTRLIKNKGLQFQDVKNLDIAIEQERTLRSSRIPLGFTLITRGFAYNQEDQLGQGDRGTVVFRGLYEGIPVAVKRLPGHLWTVAESEIACLRNARADETKHLVTCYSHCKDKQYAYLALSLCECTVYDCVQQRRIRPCDLASRSVQGRVLQELCDGMRHLHAHRLIHRDLKPTNILLDAYGTVKIADMGLTRKLVEDESHISSTSTAGTLGWQAPEVLRGSAVGAASDVFSFGLIAYYVLCRGEHVFGIPYTERVRRIEVFQPEFGLLDLSPTARHLVTLCVQQDPGQRPQFEDLLNHPYFWPVDRIVSFLQEVKKLFDQYDLVLRSKFDELTGELNVFPSEDGWYSVLGMQEVADAARNNFSQDAKRALSPLVVLLRNICSHQQQNNVWSRFETNDDAVQFFLDRFPSLLVVSWVYMREAMKILWLDPPKDLLTFYSSW